MNGKDDMTILGNDGRVEFRFFRQDVREVRIVGDFNGRATTLPMESDGLGWWSAKAMIGGGEYRFRYVADGTLYTDFAATGIEATKQGYDSILVVPHRIAKEKAAQAMVA